MPPVGQSSDQDFFRIPIPPEGSVTTISLSHLPVDADLVVYGSQTPQVLRSNVALRGTGQNPSAAPSVGPQLTSVGLPPSPQPATDVPLIDRPIYGSSVNRGGDDEVVEITSRGETGYYIVQVSGFNGATSTEPYLLRYAQFVSTGTEACRTVFPNAPGSPAAAPTLVPGTNTLVLVNSQRVRAEFGAAGWTTVQTAINSLNGANGTVSTVVPAPACVSVPVPPMALPTVMLSLRLNDSAALLVTAPVPSVPLVPPLPTCTVPLDTVMAPVAGFTMSLTRPVLATSQQEKVHK